MVMVMLIVVVMVVIVVIVIVLIFKQINDSNRTSNGINSSSDRK